MNSEEDAAVSLIWQRSKNVAQVQSSTPLRYAVLKMDESQPIVLQESAALIWQKLNNGMTPVSLAEFVTTAYDIDFGNAYTQIIEFTQSLTLRQMLTPAAPIIRFDDDPATVVDPQAVPPSNHRHESTNLSLQEAVLLIHAQLAYLSEVTGTRALLIKGPGASLQGLRATHQSTDADIWVDPTDEDTFMSRLQDLGWQRRPTDPSGSPFPPHATTLYHKEWPCDIDVHHHIPGMEKSSETCFEKFWAERSSILIAGQSIPVPSISGSVVILALNALRNLHMARSSTEYQSLTERRTHNIDEIMNLAVETNCIAALKPFLIAIMGEAETRHWPSTSANWDLLSSDASDAEKRINHFLTAPWRNKPRLLYNALFPSDSVLQLRNLYQDTSVHGKTKSYIRRYRRGLSTGLKMLNRIFRQKFKNLLRSGETTDIQ
ncbi:hypothetical protein JOF48_000322 [Arthrobacter stackebrandtii]|uniref:Nucleotidyltransferase family protein n=1 Tax=Arthrobacter stackebrandtii TaxID=272161 RepID=A0ABS4YU94_9MICC|nr:PqqD family peptide modification chaperone [Arthrobacter stackebrandtii]MBP2411523.1 hypothetical protein [Arthrobacter stackebrandtii]PYH00206.1 hypothetical protein CVV67_10595 [Arthrobacter stackebrandtii]